MQPRRKPFIVYEYGWDRTNYPTLGKLNGFLGTLVRAPEIAGDGFWALESHNDGHGWMPIPANTTDVAAAPHIETGQWWALYYPGIRTLVSTAADMSARAQAIRRHNYAMSGIRVPAHTVRLPDRDVGSTWAGLLAGLGRRDGLQHRARPTVKRTVEDHLPAVRDRRRRWIRRPRRGSAERLVSRDPVQPRRQAWPRVKGDAVGAGLSDVRRSRCCARSPRRQALRPLQTMR